MWTVYMHVNKLNNKVYIGQTKRDVSQRFRKCGKEYLAKNKRGKYYQPKFANALKAIQRPATVNCTG